VNYELKVTCSWEGELTVGDAKKHATGKVAKRAIVTGYHFNWQVTFPYICEDVEDHQFIMEVTVEGTEPHQLALKVGSVLSAFGITGFTGENDWCAPFGIAANQRIYCRAFVPLSYFALQFYAQSQHSPSFAAAVFCFQHRLFADGTKGMPLVKGEGRKDLQA